MLNKKLIFLLILIIASFSISGISAAEDGTNDLINADASMIENNNDNLILNENLNDEFILEENQNDNLILDENSNDNLTLDENLNDEFVLEEDQNDNELKDKTSDKIHSAKEKEDVNLTAKNLCGIYQHQSKFIVHVTDKDGNDINEGTITYLNVFGKDYTTDVINGTASEKLFIDEVGSFDIICEYSGSDSYNGANTTLSLFTPVTDTTCKNIVATRYGDLVYFTGNVIADYRPYQDLGDFDDYEEAAEGNLTVYVNGEEMGACDIDINGNYVFIWNATENVIGKTVNFTAFFTNAFNRYNPSNFSKSFTFPYPKNTSITAEAKLIDEDNILINGSVVDDMGNAVIGGTISLDNYSIPVDKYGQFKFYISNETSNKANYELGVMDWGSKADIRANIPLMNGIEHTELTEQIIELCKEGSPYIKFGNGNGKTIIMNVGTHGGELGSLAAGFKLINYLANYAGEINGTLYIFPVIFPEATAANVRIFDRINLNTVADEKGSISYNLCEFAISLNASGLGDFHCTRHSDSDVGITTVMCSLHPTAESHELGKFISEHSNVPIDVYEQAGVPYASAIEDRCNLYGVPAITSESLTNHRAIEYGSPEVSYSMMKAFLLYFGIDLNEMINIKQTTDNLTLLFESPYNYNSSTESVTLPKISTKLSSSGANTTYNVEKYLIATLKDEFGKAISGAKISLKLSDGQSKSLTTDKNGQIKFAIGKLAPKSYTATIKFAGDDKYKASSISAKINVKKANPQITAKAKSFKLENKNNVYTVTLKDNKGNIMKNTKLSLKIDGKTFTAKTNSKGQASFNIKIAKTGSFKAVITYAGSKYYNKLSKQTKLTFTFNTISKGSKDKNMVKKIQKALKNNGYYLSYKGHYLKVDGKYYSCTVRAVKQFQKDKKLKVTGKVDYQTAKKLKIV